MKSKADKPKVVIRKNPLITMIASAVEVYPKECLGVLFGRNTQYTFTVEHVFTYQTADRTRFSVDIDEKVGTNTINMIQKLTPLKPIGDFHSHTIARTGTKLTSIDKKEENFNVNEIEIVVAISKKKRNAHWKNYGKKLSGTLDNFKFDIAAYTCYNPERQVRKFQKIEVCCPFTINLQEGCIPRYRIRKK